MILIIRFYNTVKYRYSHANKVAVVIVCKLVTAGSASSLQAGSECLSKSILASKDPGDFTALNIQRLPYFQRDLEDRLGEKPIHKKQHECIKAIIIGLNLF